MIEYFVDQFILSWEVQGHNSAWGGGGETDVLGFQILRKFLHHVIAAAV